MQREKKKSQKVMMEKKYGNLPYQRNEFQQYEYVGNRPGYKEKPKYSPIDEDEEPEEDLLAMQRSYEDPDEFEESEVESYQKKVEKGPYKIANDPYQEEPEEEDEAWIDFQKKYIDLPSIQQNKLIHTSTISLAALKTALPKNLFKQVKPHVEANNIRAKIYAMVLGEYVGKRITDDTRFNKIADKPVPKHKDHIILELVDSTTLKKLCPREAPFIGKSKNKKSFYCKQRK